MIDIVNKWGQCLVALLTASIVSLSYAQEILTPISLYIDRTASYKPARESVLSLPFADDFSQLERSVKLWDIRGVYINHSLGNSEPTYGIASFDGMNNKMKPYSDTYNAWGGADTMTTQPIDLSGFSPADSIIVSFYVQKKGLGNDPSVEDSLILEALTKYGDWKVLWTSSATLDTVSFEWIAIKLEDTLFFHNNLKFRFRNLATLSGFFDHWNVDWFYVDANRSINDTGLLDVAIQEVPSSLTLPYTRMPWYMVQANPSYVQQLFISISNLSNAIRNTQYRFRLFAGNPQQLVDSSLFVATNLSSGTSQFMMSFTNFPGAVIPTDTGVAIRVEYIINAGGNSFTFNDTVSKTYIYDAMLAYDDGTPELAYGVEGQGAAFAYKFTLPAPDTLWGLAILFVDHVRRNNEPDLFSVVVWDDIFTNSIIARKDFQMPCEVDSGWKFCIYKFDYPIVVPSTFYAGWIQTSANAMSVGFDKNTNARANAWFNTMDTWEQSKFDGTVMIRPIIGPFKLAEKYLAQPSTSEKPVFFSGKEIQAIPISPNSYHLRASEIGNWKLFDLSGNLIMSFENKNNFVISLPYKGVFIIQWEGEKSRDALRLIAF